MAFIKISVLLLLLFVVLVAPIADARGNLFQISNDAQSLGFGQNFCSTCECETESETTICYRTDRKIGGCPLVCGEPCICTKSIPPICFCKYEVETCNPEQCNSIGTTDHMLTFEKLLAVKGA